MSDKRPQNCRNRLAGEGKPHPKSGCAVPGCKGAFGSICSQEYLVEIPNYEKDRGGQHVGMSSTAVKVTHVSTGLTATVHARSQYKSKMIAMEMIEYGLTYERDLI